MIQKGYSLIFLLIGMVVLAGVAGGAYYLGKQTTPKSSPAPVVSSQIPSPSTTTDASPVPTGTEETANWKTYTNSKRGYEFKYPDSYKLKAVETSTTARESVYLEKDAEYTVGGGFGGSNVLKKGVVISFTVWPNKDLSESALKSEYGTDISTKTTIVDNKEGIEIVFQPESYGGRMIYLKHNSIVLEFSSDSGFETSKSSQQKYLTEFDQILSTFKFTN